jgi:hypothetical protein
MATIVAVLQALPMFLSLMNDMWRYFQEMTQNMKDEDKRKFVLDLSQSMSNWRGAQSVEDKQRAAKSISDIFRKL